MIKLFLNVLKVYIILFLIKIVYILNLLKIFLSMYDSAIKLVHYGWKKEAVPIIRERKTILARLFNLIFN